MVEVIRGSVKYNGEKHVVGAILKGLSKTDEARLVESGVAKYVDGENDKKQSDSSKKAVKTVIEKQGIADDDSSEEPINQVEENITFNADDYIEEANPSKGKKSGKAGK